MHQLDRAIAKIHRHPFIERHTRETILDAAKVEHPERLAHISQIASRDSVTHHLLEHGRIASATHLLAAVAMRNDLRAFNQLIAVAVIGVRMSIDEIAHRQRARRAHRVEHRPRERQVEQGIDDQRGFAARDQARVVATPSGRRLHPCMDSPARFFERCLG